MRARAVFPLAGLAAATLALTGAQDNSRERLAHLRNLGKAYYENPVTHLQAVEEFRKALEVAPDSARERVNYGLALLRAGKTEEGMAELEKAQKQDPRIPHTWFNLGIAFKRASQYERAIQQFEQMVKLAPDEPVSHYNLGVLYKLTGRGQEALSQFEIATRLNPNLAGPHFQLFNAYRQAGRQDEAAREEKVFYALKERNAGAAVPEDLEWSFYAEIYEPIGDAETAAEADPPVKFEPERLNAGLDAASAGLATADVDGDGRPDLIAWSARGIQIFKSGAPPAADCGVGGVKDVVWVAPGDFNNDGLADLAVITTSGTMLFVNRNGRFEKSAVALPAGRFASAVWLDYDHDYDLDLVLLGEKSVLARNNGQAGFSDETAGFPFAAGKAIAGAAIDVVPDTDGMDLVVTYADRPGVLYRDRLGGHYEAQDLVALPAGAGAVAARDFNNDGWTDLAASTRSGLRLMRNRRGQLEPLAAMTRAGGPLAFADFENHGLADLVSTGAIHRNEGAGKLRETPAPLLERAVALAAADFDGDGRTDLAAVQRDGSLDLLHNKTETKSNWLEASLLGVKNLKTAYGSKVEVKAGTRYQKQTYRGVPLEFGLGPVAEVDTVRITWPNGLIQNEIRPAVGKAALYKEAPRLSGSCPMIFTWDGRQFDFLTDVLGVAPLGASAGDGRYFPVAHREHIRVPGGRLAESDGRYQVRITEELREVSYIDQVQLIGLDHPAGVDWFTNDKFSSPPFPEFRLFGVPRRIYPVAARDQRGGDVLERVLRSDGRYVDTFSRDAAGLAEMHSLTLDFGPAAPANRAVLLLGGWVDWADGSTFRAVSQERRGGLVMPYLQVKDATGRWRTVIEDMGLPAGKPKVIAVDLTGKFLSASREVRIVTNLCVYWDEVFLSEQAGPPVASLTGLGPSAAELRFRGFSTPVIDPERKQPERFLYGRLLERAPWNPTPGRYTRYGDVRPLLGEADDRMVIMGSGDELKLEFDARRLPPLRPGWKRDFLLMVDGWAKDADANTAFARSVEPLPFHGMSAYPYSPAERFPAGRTHREYLRDYNTRPALRLLRPLWEE